MWLGFTLRDDRRGVFPQVDGGAPPGIRTQNLRIKRALTTVCPVRPSPLRRLWSGRSCAPVRPVRRVGLSSLDGLLDAGGVPAKDRTGLSVGDEGVSALGSRCNVVSRTSTGHPRASNDAGPARLSPPNAADRYGAATGHQPAVRERWIPSVGVDPAALDPLVRRWVGPRRAEPRPRQSRRAGGNASRLNT